MLTKKVLIAVGLVCVLAPAAFAVMKDGGPVSHVPKSVRASAEVLIASLQQFLARRDEPGDARIPAHFGPMSKGKTPFTRLARAKMIDRRIARFLEHGMELNEFGPSSPIGDGAEPGYASMGDPEQQAGGSSSGVGGGSYSSARGGSGPRFARASGRGLAGGSGTSWAGSGPAAPGGAGTGGAELPGGVGGSASEATTAELLLEDQVADDNVLSMPVPASLWMLIGAMAGLGALGYRRGVASS